MKRKFGIIGSPINHSLSPVLHKYWFNKYNIDADYLIIEAKDKELPEIIKKIKQGEFSGINVTLPFKQKIINYIDRAVNDAELTGSVNTVLLDNDKTVIGENTDVYGLQAAYLKEIENSSNKKALVIGAGGVSPSVILSIKKSGIKSISITNRTQAIKTACQLANANDIILLAGKGHENYQEIKGEKIHFSDFEVARKCLNKLQK